jgi:hypothetical protein
VAPNYKGKRMSRCRWIAVLLTLVLPACGQDGPPFIEAAASIPPVAPQMARIYFYRDLEIYRGLSWRYLYLNGQVVGISIPGGVFYRDVPPGLYLISVDTDEIYWDPFKNVLLAPGDVLYAKVESLPHWYVGRTFAFDTFVVALIDPRQAAAELLWMRFVQARASRF